MILKYCYEKQYKITNIHLNKILYYIAKDYYINHKKDLYKESFIYWRHGANIPNIYREYNRYIDFLSNNLWINLTKVKNFIFKELCIQENTFNVITKEKEISFKNLPEFLTQMIIKNCESYILYNKWDLVELNNRELENFNIKKDSLFKISDLF